MKNGFLIQMVVVCLVLTGTQTFAQKRTANKVFVSPATPQVSTNTLPIRRVILYSNGVAYVERRGLVSGRAEVNLPFKQSQVDDVLKSMVVLDLGKGRIGAVSYNSSAPPNAKMAEIPFSVSAQSGQSNGIAGVLAQLQGAKVAVSTAKGSVTGSILTVEKRPVTQENKLSTTRTFLVIASESGELSTFDLDEVKSVKLLEEGTRRDINEFANATAQTRRRDAKTITVTSDGAGQREMVVSYTIAAPVWKTTYRVVLDQEGKPFFQGWAIVDNVSDEDWSDVQLSLVSGSPISFIQPIQQPVYRYRPVVTLPTDLKITPQVYEESNNFPVAADSIGGVIRDSAGAVVPNASVTITNSSTGRQISTQTDENGNFMQSALPPGSYAVTVDRAGFKRLIANRVARGANLNLSLDAGNVAETVTVDGASGSENSFQVDGLPTNARSFTSLLQLAPGARPETKVSDALLSNKSGIDTAATGGELGDLFEYKIDQPVTVNRDRSALIPIVQTKMDGERVSIYNESVRKDRPMGGMKLVNTTQLTLEGGSMTILDKDAYAGEALMERLKPKEERLISFALDLATSVSVKYDFDNSPAKLFKVVKGVFEAHYFRNEKKTYSLQNQTDRPRVVYIEHARRNGWDLSPDGPQPIETTQTYYRFRVELGAFAKKDLEVDERQGLKDAYALTNITSADLELFISKHYIDEATKARIEKLIAARNEIDQINGKLNDLNTEERKIGDDQKRIRENIEALSKTPEAKVLIERYIAKANDQESRLEAIGKERAALRQDFDQAQGRLVNEITNFSLK